MKHPAILNGGSCGFMLAAAVSAFHGSWDVCAGNAGLSFAFFFAGFYWGQR